MENICKHTYNLNGLVKHKRHDAGLEATFQGWYKPKTSEFRMVRGDGVDVHVSQLQGDRIRNAQTFR